MKIKIKQKIEIETKTGKTEENRPRDRKPVRTCGNPTEMF
jgi:hypothetical protein